MDSEKIYELLQEHKKGQISRRDFLRLSVAVGGLAAVQALASACTAPAPTATPRPVVVPTATKGPTKGGILRVANVLDSTILGYPPTMAKLYDFTFASTSLETLLKFDETGAPVAGLAKEWNVDVAAKTITLVLQKDVKFHDGTDFNAEVAKWNLDSVRESARTELKGVDSIDVVDDHTIRLNLSTFDNMVLVNLGGPAGLMISQAAFEKNGAEWCEKNPVGTGPFKLASWQTDVKQVYERFDGYWQTGKPHLDGMEWVIIPDPMVRLASFKAGEVDVTLDVEPKDAKEMETEGKYNISSLSSGLYGIAGHSAQADSPFADVKVRQAMEHAIDKQAICDTLGYGYWEPPYQAAAPGRWAENPDVVGYRYDPAKAKELLAEAGYPDGFKTTIYVMATPQIIVDMVTAAQGYLKEVGIDAALETMDHPRFGEFFAGTAWQDGIAMMPMGLSPDEIGLLNRLFLPGSILLPGIARPPEFQQKLAEVSAAPDFATKQKLTWELQKIGVDNAMVTWIHTSVGLSARQLKVHDDGFSKILGVEWTPADAWKET
jgi:peptide/nickel transport system substrate-binding protein